jgi:hypothetical protein
MSHFSAFLLLQIIPGSWLGRPQPYEDLAVPRIGSRDVHRYAVGRARGDGNFHPVRPAGTRRAYFDGVGPVAVEIGVPLNFKRRFAERVGLAVETQGHPAGGITGGADQSVRVVAERITA